MSRRFLFIADHGCLRRRILLRCIFEFRFPKQPASKSNHASTEDDCGEWNLEKVDGDKSERSQRPHHFVFERFPADANDGGQNDCGDGGFQSVKDGRDPRNVAESCVNETQPPENENRRDNKERTGDDAAPGLVQEPADVDGKLLRFRTW